MAHYQFDFTFVNLAALPAGAYHIGLNLFFENYEYDYGYGLIPASGDLTITTTTAAPDYGPPFELSATDKVWAQVAVTTDQPKKYLGVYVIGPYEVGDIGTEVPAP